MARQDLGSVGKIDNGIVAVTSLWAGERCYWPVHAVPYTPASGLAGGGQDPGFKTKPQLAVELVQEARQAGIAFRAVVADCFYGDNPGFTDAPVAAKIPFLLALKPCKGTWAPAEAAHTPVEAAGELGWYGPTKPGRWRRVIRSFRDGHTEAWWAADAQLGGWGPDRPLRLVVASTDPASLPGHSTWYLLTKATRGRQRQPKATPTMPPQGHEPDTPAQLALDALVAPAGILPGEADDQLLGALGPVAVALVRGAGRSRRRPRAAGASAAASGA